MWCIQCCTYLSLPVTLFFFCHWTSRCSRKTLRFLQRTWKKKKKERNHQHRSCNTKRRPNRTVSIQIHQLPPLQLFQVAARPSTKLLSINGADSPLAAAMTLRSGAREADPTVPPSTVLYKRKGVIKRAQMAGYLP